MKPAVTGIVISHKRGGTYVMDRDGFLSFVYGHTSKPIGTEIVLKNRTISNEMKLRMLAATACLILTLSFSFCSLIGS